MYRAYPEESVLVVIDPPGEVNEGNARPEQVIRNTLILLGNWPTSFRSR